MTSDRYQSSNIYAIVIQPCNEVSPCCMDADTTVIQHFAELAGQ